MTRKNVFLWLLTIILGLVAGWFLWSWLSGLPDASPVHPSAKEAASKPRSRAGYCCTNPGNACEQVTDPDLCFRGGGLAFNAVERNCDYYCINVKP